LLGRAVHADNTVPAMTAGSSGTRQNGSTCPTAPVCKKSDAR
jgi:hypothetical protein